MHVVQRGNNRSACFFGDADRRFFLRCLDAAARRHGCAIHAYVLMTNHVHLLVTPMERGAIGAMLQDVGRRYVRVLNIVHARTGSLWEGRYKASLIDSDCYFLTCQRYIELNPVRAGIVHLPDQYAWSSHAHYALGRTSPLIVEHPLHAALGTTPENRQTAYRALFDEPLHIAVIDKIRNALNTDSALGSEKFMTTAESQLGRSVRIPKRGRPAKVVTGKLL
jgi:putative transposase